MQGCSRTRMKSDKDEVVRVECYSRHSPSPNESAWSDGESRMKAGCRFTSQQDRYPHRHAGVFRSCNLVWLDRSGVCFLRGRGDRCGRLYLLLLHSIPSAQPRVSSNHIKSSLFFLFPAKDCMNSTQPIIVISFTG